MALTREQINKLGYSFFRRPQEPGYNEEYLGVGSSGIVQKLDSNYAKYLSGQGFDIPTFSRSDPNDPLRRYNTVGGSTIDERFFEGEIGRRASIEAGKAEEERVKQANIAGGFYTGSPQVGGANEALMTANRNALLPSGVQPGQPFGFPAAQAFYGANQVPSSPTATSIVDFLKSQGKDSSFAARKTLYDSLGLASALGDYRGTADQNTTLLKRASAGSPQGGAGGGTGAGGTASRTPRDVISETTPSTIQTLYDLDKSDAEKAADAEKAQLSMDLGAETARGAEGLQRDVATANRTASEGLFDLATAGTKKKGKIAESAAGFGGAFAGKTLKEQADVQAEVEMKQGRLKEKLGDVLYNAFSDFEKQYGTEFLSKLSIPEAESFSKLPVAVRGIVMKNYQDAIGKAEEKAAKGTIDALDKLGFVVLGGQIVPKDAFKEPDKTGEQETFEYAKSQGYKGSYLDWKKYQATQYGTEEPDSSGGGSVKIGGLTFTRNEAQSGAANANVSLDDFKRFSEAAANLFVNANQQVKDKVNEIDKALEQRTRSVSQIQSDISGLQAPDEVKNYLRKYLDSKSSTAPQGPGFIGKAIDFFFD